jgi:hypothetical protein
MSGREFAKQDDAVDAVKKSLKVSFHYMFTALRGDKCLKICAGTLQQRPSRCGLI